MIQHTFVTYVQKWADACVVVESQLQDGEYIPIMAILQLSVEESHLHPTWRIGDPEIAILLMLNQSIVGLSFQMNANVSYI